jgi:7-cyano-7-deazaguanine synthase in queuosine biosynthesis
MNTVILYSGGLDSYCTAFLMEPDVLLAVDTGTAYGDTELLKMQAPPGYETKVQYAGLQGLAKWERPGDLILPGRNAHLVLAAANYGDTIYMAATAGDRVTDKDDTFADLMNELFKHLYQPQWWLPGGRRVRLELPVKHLTKRQIVAAYLMAGGDPDAVVERTFSCYYPKNDEACGGCKPCVRRYVALILNDLKPDVDCSRALSAWNIEARSDHWDRGAQEAADVIEATTRLYEGRIS